MVASGETTILSAIKITGTLNNYKMPVQQLKKHEGQLMLI